MSEPRRYKVQFIDGTTESISVDEAEAQSEDHVFEMIADASSRPDEVEDWWPDE